MADYTHGRFVWRELMTSDLEAAKRYYSELFGWATKVFETRGHPYVIVEANGKGVGGMMPLMQQRVPPNWTSYLSIADVDAGAERAKSAGGNVVHAPSDIPNVGRFATVVDPTGAAVTLFKSSQGDAPVARPSIGEFCWESLLTPDTKASIAFYEKVAGWKANEGVPGMTTFGTGDGMAGQVADLMAPPPGVPSHWATYVVVDTLTDAVARVRRLGGTVDMDNIEIPNIGKMAATRDPQGASLCLFESAMG